MKKLLISLISVVALSVTAKTADQLVDEYLAAAKGKICFDVAKDIVDKNTSDVAEAIKVWSVGEPAKFGIDYEDKRTPENQRKVHAARMLSGEYFRDHHDAILTVPQTYALLTNMQVSYEKFSVDNPLFYQQLKANGFKIDGKELPKYVQCALARYANDIEYLATLPAGQITSSDASLHKAIEYLLNQKDAQAAFNKIQEVENYFILAGKPEPVKVKAAWLLLKRRLLAEGK